MSVLDVAGKVNKPNVRNWEPENRDEKKYMCRDRETLAVWSEMSVNQYLDLSILTAYSQWKALNAGFDQVLLSMLPCLPPHTIFEQDYAPPHHNVVVWQIMDEIALIFHWNKGSYILPDRSPDLTSLPFMGICERYGLLNFSSELNAIEKMNHLCC